MTKVSNSIPISTFFSKVMIMIKMIVIMFQKMKNKIRLKIEIIKEIRLI